MCFDVVRNHLADSPLHPVTNMVNETDGRTNRCSTRQVALALHYEVCNRLPAAAALRSVCGRFDADAQRRPLVSPTHHRSMESIGTRYGHWRCIPPLR